MSPLFYVFFSLLFFYLVILGWLAFGFIRTKFFIPLKKYPQLPVTIIICGRNEERHIALCLKSILKQEYDRHKIQLIFINDASSDKTLQIAQTILSVVEINYKIISNQHRKGKKESITEAMSFAQNELIITRDADTFTL
jgi:biofilm PGA synthesis N-glycosyltransferase PgaC